MDLALLVEANVPKRHEFNALQPTAGPDSILCNAVEDRATLESDPSATAGHTAGPVFPREYRPVLPAGGLKAVNSKPLDIIKSIRESEEGPQV